VVCDAETPEDLDHIALHARDLPGAGFFAGSAGLASALAGASACAGPRTIELDPARSGTLIAVGSPARVSREAAARLADHLGSGLVRVEMGAMDDGPSLALFSLSIANRLMQGQDVVVRLDSPFGSGPDSHYARVFAGVLAPALRHMGGLIVTGGETAAALLAECYVDGIQLLDEVEPGMALGVTRGKVRVPIVTKPGAFGDEESLVRCLNRMRELGKRR
jgi:D-threonate/D-erythronate kinase